MKYDVHAHLDFFKKEELVDLIKNAEKENVSSIITNSVDLISCIKNLEIAKNYDIVRLAIGIYPSDKITRHDLFNFKDFFEKHKNSITAIGEIGMDFQEGKDKKVQESVLKFQLNIARENGLPVIVHSRKAEKEVLEILKEYSSLKIILHCFSGNFNLVKKAVELGCYFSIPTNIVRSEHFQKMILEIPKEKVLTETDSPFLSPYKETKNQSAFIKESIKKISEIWKTSEELVEKQIEKNFKDVFA